MTFPFCLDRVKRVGNDNKLLLDGFLKHADRGCFRFDLLKFSFQTKVFQMKMVEGENWGVKERR